MLPHAHAGADHPHSIRSQEDAQTWAGCGTHTRETFTFVLKFELEHGQSKQHSAVLDAVNRHGRSKSTISRVRGPCLTLRSKEESFYRRF